MSRHLSAQRDFNIAHLPIFAEVIPLIPRTISLRVIEKILLRATHVHGTNISWLTEFGCEFLCNTNLHIVGSKILIKTYCLSCPTLEHLVLSEPLIFIFWASPCLSSCGAYLRIPPCSTVLYEQPIFYCLSSANRIFYTCTNFWTPLSNCLSS